MNLVIVDRWWSSIDTELGARNPDMPSLLSLYILNIDIRFPDLGTTEKNVIRMRKFQDVFLSRSEMNVSK